MVNIPRWLLRKASPFLFTLLFLQNAFAEDLYQQALLALQQGQIKHYQALRKQLDQHPLAIYLDYNYYSPRIHQISAEQLNAFNRQAEGSPVAQRLTVKYLDYTGHRRQWKNFLSVSPNEPTQTRLRCYYNQALLAEGQSELAYQGTVSLWLSGSSQPKECDALFEAWRKSGQRSNEHIWERMILAFDAKETQLLNYLNRSLNGDFKQDGDRLLTLYQSPQLLETFEKELRSSPRIKDFIRVGLRKLARSEPQQAVLYWQTFSKQLEFEENQRSEIQKHLVRYAYLKNDEQASDWADKQLASLQVDQLTELRLRQLLKRQDWANLEKRLPDLSLERQQSEIWQYWLAYIEQRHGKEQQAQQRLTDIATHRGYYAYLAAQQLNLPLSLAIESAPLLAEDNRFIEQEPGYIRIQALLSQDETDLANSEWVYLLRRTNASQKIAMAHLALEQGWWHMAISAAIRAEAWHDVALRFPLAFQESFQTIAASREIEESLLMAIARRESTYNPRAYSAKGARGLMQLMPNTASHTARKIRMRYAGSQSLYQPSTNIKLGSTYLKQLLTQFDQNKILSIAAYNAGPSRVKEWLNDGPSLPFDLWVETIPFQETRDYVKAVLAYRVIYDRLLHPESTEPMLSITERSASY